MCAGLSPCIEWRHVKCHQTNVRLGHTCHNKRWFVLSSRPAVSSVALLRKSSYPSPPLMTIILVAMVRVWMVMDARRLMWCFDPDDDIWPIEVGGISTQVKNRTWPVWPRTRPMGKGTWISSTIINKLPENKIITFTYCKTYFTEWFFCRKWLSLVWKYIFFANLLHYCKFSTMYVMYAGQ